MKKKEIKRNKKKIIEMCKKEKCEKCLFSNLDSRKMCLFEMPPKDWKKFGTTWEEVFEKIGRGEKEE